MLILIVVNSKVQILDDISMTW